jgi:diguanylate cyclase (GGDEF)-like protein
MEYQATTDVLTAQMNRRALDAMLHNYTSAAQGRQFRFSALMLDIDHFKQINDTHGHPVGDQALAAVAQRIVAQLRGGDSCARYGGEEFVVMLPDASLVQALEVAQRIRQAVAASPLPTEPPLRVTVSIGVAQHRPGMTAQALLAAADAAVYLAKREGRNQVRAAPATPDPGPSTETAQPQDPEGGDRRHR